MSQRRHSNVTIRSGTSEKHWYAIAGYLALSILGMGWVAWLIYEGGAEVVAGMALAMVAFAMAAGGVLVMPSLFKDSAYVRDTRAGWLPKWWYYIGAPFVVGIAAKVALDTAAPEYSAASLFAFVVAVFCSHAYYLYQRHRHLGVP